MAQSLIDALKHHSKLLGPVYLGKYYITFGTKTTVFSTDGDICMSTEVPKDYGIEGPVLAPTELLDALETLKEQDVTFSYSGTTLTLTTPTSTQVIECEYPDLYPLHSTESVRGFGPVLATLNFDELGKVYTAQKKLVLPVEGIPDIFNLCTLINYSSDLFLFNTDRYALLERRVPITTAQSVDFTLYIWPKVLELISGNGVIMETDAGIILATGTRKVFQRKLSCAVRDLNTLLEPDGSPSMVVDGKLLNKIGKVFGFCETVEMTIYKKQITFKGTGKTNVRKAVETIPIINGIEMECTVKSSSFLVFPEEPGKLSIKGRMLLFQAASKNTRIVIMTLI